MTEDDLEARLVKYIAEQTQAARSDPEIPEHVRLARAKGDAVPLGMHVCQSARADGASWVYYDDYWECPFCEDRGEGWERSEVADP